MKLCKRRRLAIVLATWYPVRSLGGEGEAKQVRSIFRFQIPIFNAKSESIQQRVHRLSAHAD